jgi:hypothetical protein
MGNDIEKFKARERIKVASWKHRGNIIEIAAETGFKEDYIRVELQKIKKENSRDINALMSSTMMQYLFDGHQQRISYIQEMIRSLNNSESVQVSDCCKAPLRISKKDSGEDLIKCRTCDGECKPTKLTQTEIYHLKMKLIEALKSEDASLVLFISKMGYSNAPPQERGPIIKQEFVVVGGGNNKQKVESHVTHQEALTMEQIAALPPAERDKLRRELQRSIIDLTKEQVTTEGK